MQFDDDLALAECKRIALDHAVSLVRDNRAIAGEIVDLAGKFEAFLTGKPVGPYAARRLGARRNLDGELACDLAGDLVEVDGLA